MNSTNEECPRLRPLVEWFSFYDESLLQFHYFYSHETFFFDIFILAHSPTDHLFSCFVATYRIISHIFSHLSETGSKPDHEGELWTHLGKIENACLRIN